MTIIVNRIEQTACGHEQNRL